MALKTRLMRVLKSPGPRLERLFAGRFDGTTTCELSQELTPGLVELKATGVFMAFVPFTDAQPIESHTSGGGLSNYGSSRGPFPQFVPDGRGSYGRGSFFHFFFSLNVLSIWEPGQSSVPGNVTMFLLQQWYVTPYYEG